jgi:hypothetical protein
MSAHYEEIVRAHEPQPDCGQAERTERQDGSRRPVDTCAGGGNSAPFRRKRRRVKTRQALGG